MLNRGDSRLAAWLVTMGRVRWTGDRTVRRDTLPHHSEDVMLTTFRRYATLAIAAGLTAAACSTHDNSATTDTAAGAIGANRDSGGAMGTSANNGTGNNSWTEPEILGFTSVSNIAEVQEGKLGATKATNPAVKAFAKQLQTDHQAMLTEGQSFASKNNIVPDTTRGEVRDALKDASDEYKELNEAKAGKDWDENFVDKQIDGHQKTLDKLNEAAQAATNPDLKAMLTKAAGKVQEHLTKAKDLKANALKS
jgi:putative membrane protein